jgi:hypothetical protein
VNLPFCYAAGFESECTNVGACISLCGRVVEVEQKHLPTSLQHVNPYAEPQGIPTFSENKVL